MATIPRPTTPADGDRYIPFRYPAKYRFHRAAESQVCPQANRKIPGEAHRRAGRNLPRYTAGERGVGPKQARRGTLPDAEPRPHRGADLPHQRAKEKVDTAKTAPRDIRGVTQGQRQLRTAANETVRNVTTQAQVQTRTRQVQLAMQKAAANTRKTATAVRSAIRHFLASLRSLVTAIVTGISVHSAL